MRWAGTPFDYALDADRALLAIFDAMGHGLQASLTTALALGAYRHCRRAAADLAATLAATDAAIAEEFSDGRFVTALFGELELATGRMRLLNAGHLQPVLLRGHRVVDLVDVPPGLPLGLGGMLPPDHDRVAEITCSRGTGCCWSPTAFSTPATPPVSRSASSGWSRRPSGQH